MLANLRIEMYKRKVTIESVAEYLAIHRNSVSNKLEGDTEFSIEEAFKVRDRFFPDLDMDYLFKKDENNPPDKKGA